MKPSSAFPEGKKIRWVLQLFALMLMAALLLPWPASVAQSQQMTPMPLMVFRQVKVIEAEADSFVYYDYHDPYTQVDTNFGSEPFLQIGRLKDPVLYPWQMAYMRFRVDLTDLPPSAVISSAWAQLYYTGKYEFRGIYNLDYGLSSNDWDEYKITYNNQPNRIFLINPEPALLDTTQDGWVNILNFVDRGPEWLKNGVSFVSMWVGLREGDENTLFFSSREGDFPPHILVAFYLPPTDTPAPFRPLRITATPTEEPTPIPLDTGPFDDSGGGIVYPDCPLIGCQIPWWVIGGIAAAGAAIIGYLLFRPRKPIGGTKEPPVDQPPKKPIIPPALPPPRLMRFWLTQSGPGGEKPVGDGAALAAGARYNLNVQIQVRQAGQRAESPATGERIPLDVVLFSPENDFEVERHRVTIEVPAVGDSTPVAIPIRAQTAGTHRVRICLYYHNTLLQSGVLEAAVTAAGTAGARGTTAAITRQLDYVASPDLTRLEQYTQPVLNIFTNDTAEGTHWIGLYSSDRNAGENFKKGELFVFDADHLGHLAQTERQSLATVQGERSYRLKYDLPLDDRSLTRLEENLVGLAIEGYKLYNELFLNDPTGLGMATLREFDRVLHTPGIISVARCRGTSSSLPWAALYTFPLDVDHPEQLRMCEFLKQDLRANQWAGRTVIKPVHDYLDAPQTCLGRAGCPARNPDEHCTVCPFGFWGMMHQIEQPLQQIKPSSVDETPETLKKRNFAQDGVLLWKAQQKLRCAVGVNRSFQNDDQVYAEIQSIVPAQNLEIEYSNDSERILALIKDGGRHFYYFFCHGVAEGNTFKLDFSPGSISSAGLYPFDMNWPEQPKPLFILNGCETTATKPELIHGFLDKLRLLGASGVVGTEIQVVVDLAVPFGKNLMDFLLNGNSIGETFLKLRTDFLRQGNPLGLAYTYYAPAGLHLHQEGNCPWCRAHGLAEN